MATTRKRKATPAPRRRVKRGPPIPWTKKLRAALERLALVGIVLFVLGVLSIVGAFWYYGRDLPTVVSMREYQPSQVTRVLDRNGALIGELFEERRTVVAMSKIPRVVVLAFLAAEDADFYRHRGLDYQGILRAIFRDVVSGRPVQGASTITQQIVKNIFLSHERTVTRKVRELILARRLEQELEKDEILHLYLNNIYFGHGRYGIQEASRYYYGKNVEDLSLAEASLLAGVPQAPSRLSPRSNPEAAKKRQAFVFKQLRGKRDAYWPDLTLEEIDQAEKETPKLVDIDEASERAPEMMRQVRTLLNDLVGEEQAKKGGYKVHTTLDLKLQAQVRRALRKGLRNVDARHGYRGPFRASKRKKSAKSIKTIRYGKTYVATVTKQLPESNQLELDLGGHKVILDLRSAARYNPKKLSASEFAQLGSRVRVSAAHIPEDESFIQARLELGPQGAAIVMDPRTREVHALVGGYETTSGFDRATQAIRQPGSAFKPIVYAKAIQSRRFTPATLVLDAPEVFERYKPSNYETWNFQGAVRLRQALAKSINLVAIRVIEDIGPASVAEFARKAGISTKMDPSLPLALGASGVKSIELVNAYATFAAGGRFESPRFVTKILDAEGKKVSLPQNKTRSVMSAAEAFVISSMMTSVVQEGTGSAALKLGKTIAGKNRDQQ